MANLVRTDDPNIWNVVHDNETIGSVSGCNILGSWQYIATFKDNPVPGPFGSKEQALIAIVDVLRKE